MRLQDSRDNQTPQRKLPLLDVAVLLLLLLAACQPLYAEPAAEKGAELDFKEVMPVDCVYPDYAHLDSALFATARELTAIVTGEECVTELTSIADLEKRSLLYVTDVVASDCGDSGMKLERLTYDTEAGVLTAHLRRWNDQNCEAASVFERWFDINRVPAGTALRIEISGDRPAVRMPFYRLKF